MVPTLSLPGKTVSTYALAALAGILVAGWFACVSARKKGMDDNDMLIVLLAAGVGAFGGGHLLYAILHIHALAWLIAQTDTLSPVQWWACLWETIGGSVFYGGLAGGLLLGGAAARKRRLPAAGVCDIAACTIPLMHGFGRIGCFLGGCCYGVPCAFGLTYTHSLVPAADGVPRFLVQLLEATLNWALFIVLSRLLWRGVLRGRLLGVYGLAYPTLRFGLEYGRGDAYRGFWLGLSTSQWISLGVFAATMAWWLWWLWRPRNRMSHRQRKQPPDTRPYGAGADGCLLREK